MDCPNGIFIKKNYVLGVVNGALFHLMMALMNPTIVLSVFILHLSGSSKMVGLVVSLTTIGWLWPQIFLSSRVDAARRKKPAYIVSAVSRSLTLVAIPAVVLLFGREHSQAMLWTVAGLLFAFASLGGLGLLAFMDIISRSMPPNLRGRFFGERAFYGGMLGLAAALFARYVLSERSGLSFPSNYLIIFTFAAVAGTFSLVIFCLAVEPPHGPIPRRLGFIGQLRRGPKLIRRDKAFRRYVGARILIDFMAIAAPFYAVYAKRQFGIPDATLAIFMAVQVICSVISSLMWGRIGDRLGNKLLLTITSGLAISGPLLAFFAQGLVRVFPHGQVVLFAIIFGAYGLTYGGLMIGRINYLLDIAPANRRSTYVGFMNAFVAPLTFAPMLGGWLAETVSFTFVFALAAISGTAGCAATFLMQRPARRERVVSMATPVPPLRASASIAAGDRSKTGR